MNSEAYRRETQQFVAHLKRHTLALASMELAQKQKSGPKPAHSLTANAGN